MRRTLAPAWPRMNRYDGATDFNVFIDDFERIGKACQWTKKEKYDKLRGILGGVPAKMASRNKHTDYVQLRKLLADRYAVDIEPATAWLEVSALKQDSLTLEEYYGKVYDAIFAAMPDDPTHEQITAEKHAELREKEMVRRFAMGLKHNYVKCMVLEKETVTLTEALNAAKKARAMLKSVHGKAAPEPTFATRVADESEEDFQEEEEEEDFSIRQMGYQNQYNQYRGRGSFRGTSGRGNRSRNEQTRALRSNEEIARQFERLRGILNKVKGGDPEAMSRSSSPDETRACFYCKQPGHLSFSCPSKMADEAKELADRLERLMEQNTNLGEESKDKAYTKKAGD